MVEVKKEIKGEPVIDRYELAQVPETMRTVVSDTKNNTIFTEIEALVLILNKVEKIERSVA